MSRTRGSVCVTSKKRLRGRLRFLLRRLKYPGEMVNGGRSKPREHARACESVFFSVPLARYFSRHLPDGVLARGLHGFFRWLKEIFTGWKLTFFRANLRSQVTFNGTMGCSHSQRFQNDIRGRSRWRVQGVRTPPEMTCGFLIQLVFCKKKNWSLLVLKSRARDECTPS